MQQYNTRSTSTSSAVVEERVLSQSSLTRRVIKPTIVNNPNNNEASIKITILHQRATKKNEFENIPEEPLTMLKAREIAKLTLDSAETKALYDELQNLYFIYDKAGVPRGENSLIIAPGDEVVIADPEKVKVIKQLIDQGHSTEIWHQLIDTDPDLATKLTQARLQQNRTEILEIFAEMLKNDPTESRWQDFFEQNTWIFGYGLRYQILRTVASQPSYGGQRYDGQGENKGDFLQCTQGNIKFTVLVEIKKPSTLLLDVNQYRNGAYIPSKDLAGGVSQLRSNARIWEREGSRTDENAEKLKDHGIFTVKPKTILVIGNTNEITASLEKRNSFELFRQGQNDIEVLTFDELFERARFIVEHEN